MELRPWRNRYFLLQLALTSPILATTGNRQGNYTSISDAFWQLANITAYTKSPAVLNGGQNFTHCCLVAVNESLIFNNGYIEKSSTYFLVDTTIDQLIDADKNGQFPCDAASDTSFQEFVVIVPYDWLSAECPGWEIIQVGELTWVQSLVSFVLPAVVFCLAIPRRHKLKVHDTVFRKRFNNALWLLTLPASIAFALLIEAIDILVWLAICFAFAAPMLLSALQEAYIDMSVSDRLADAYRHHRVPIRDRARILFTLLVGNLDMDTPEREPQQLSQPLLPTPGPVSAWDHVNHLVEHLSSEALEAAVNPGQLIETVKTRLKTMLLCQYSFGTTVGAPVIFFTGGFLVALLSATTDPTDGTASLALAFAMWFMIIPHIAIVTGLLLAGNNPNTFAGIVSARPFEEPKGYHFTELTYQSCFQPAPLWSRGPTKLDWLWKVDRDHPLTDCQAISEALSSKTKMWMFMIVGTVALLGVPFVLAFLTVFFTPEVGLSCRSFTFMVHFCMQFGLGILWIIAVVFRNYNVDSSTWDLLDENYMTQNQSAGFNWIRIRVALTAIYRAFHDKPAGFVCSLIWHSLVVICGTISVLSSIGGTIMQLMGVYSADICYVTTNYWFDAAALGQSPVVISQNDPLSIKSAYGFWETCGGIGTAFMGVVAFFAWWYQKRLRIRFASLVDNIDKTDPSQPLPPGL